MSKKKKLPAFHFYPGDWFKDCGIQALNATERGVWFQMLLLMFESDRRGYLQLGKKKYPDDLLTKILRISPKKFVKIISKLIQFDIVSIEKNTEIFYSRRMVRDEETRQSLIKAGQKGSRRRWGNESESIASPKEKKIGSPEDENEDENEKGKVIEGIGDFTIDDLNLVKKFRLDIIDFKPGFRFEYSQAQEAAEVQFIRRSRKKDITQILDLWCWARTDDFWKKNILSARKLSKNWDKLEIARDNVSGGGDADSWLKKRQEEKRKGKL